MIKATNIRFVFEGREDETQFDTQNEMELAQLWWMFCKENGMIECDFIQIEDEDEGYLDEEKYQLVVQRLREMIKTGWSKPCMVACIYDLFQNYIIDEDQERDLYYMADPDDEYNNCSEYWHEMNYDNPLMEAINY